MKNNEFKVLLSIFVIAFILTAAGLIGALGNFQLSFASEQLSNALSWLIFGTGLLLIMYINIYMSIDYRTNKINADRFKNQVDVLQKRIYEYSNLYNESEIARKAAEHSAKRYKKLSDNEAKYTEAFEIQKNHIAKIINQRDLLKSECEKLNRLANSRQANIVKLSNQVKRRTESVNELRKMYAAVVVKNSLLEAENYNLKH
jgi:hypothetical protein